MGYRLCTMNQKSVILICATFMLGGVLGYLIVGGALNHRAASSAQTLCRAIQPGMQKEQLIALAETHRGWFEMNSMDIGRAGANGWGKECRCSIGFRGNSVSGVGQAVCSR